MRGQATKAVYALLLVTALWGLTFPLIKQAMEQVSPAEFVVLRFLLSITFFLPLLIRQRKYLRSSVLWAGFIFGSLEAACYLCQTIGVQTIDSSQSAFITTFSVVIAPCIAPLFSLSKPTAKDILASLCCLLGIFVLTGARFQHMQVGVAWTFGCAFFYAISVNYLSYVSQKISATAAFVGAQVLLGLPLPLAYWLSTKSVGIGMTSWHTITYVALLFCAMTTLLSYYLQTRYQRHLAVGQFMLIYALEPIFASIFGVLINHSAIHLRTVIGGAIILLSLCIAGIGKYAVEEMQAVDA